MAYISVDVDLDEFDDDEIIEAAISIAEGDPKIISDIKAALFPDEAELKGDTLRDEQYYEVFERLKQVYSVPELEAILNKRL